MTTPPLPLLLCLALLVPAAVAHAQGTVALSGRVVDWTGKPVAGAAVAHGALSAWTTAQLQADAPARTDEDGRFSVRVADRGALNLPEVELLQIASPGFAAVGIAPSWRRPEPNAPRDERRLDTDLGEIVLADGAKLFGRVRDQDGRPIQGAVVEASDLLDLHRVLPGPRTHARCRAVTDKSGIFQLPFALPIAVRLELSSPGYCRQSVAPVAVGTPLEVTLAPAGMAMGRVLDADGKSVEGAIVQAYYEVRGPVTRVVTEPDGSFALPLERQGRYRISARLMSEADSGRRIVTRTAESATLTGAVANLELQLSTDAPRKDGSAPPAPLRVEAYAQADGAPAIGMRAAGSWQAFVLQNANYADYVLTPALRRAAPSADHAATIDGPGANESQTGIVRVTAPGYAPTTVRDVEWRELEDGAERPPLVVRMVKEATVAGRVVDETTGAPIQGASVWAEMQPDPSQGSYNRGKGPPPEAVRSAADGTFTVGGLGAGTWLLRFAQEGRPPATSVQVELQDEEHKQGVVLELPEGARVQGRVTGMPIPQGSKVFLHPIAQPRFNSSSYVFSQIGASQKPEDAIALATDGSFEFTGVPLASFTLVVDLPSPPRCGGSLAVPIEPLRVRREGTSRDFDGSADVPGRIRGRVVFPRATPAVAALMVVAEQVSEDPNERKFVSRAQVLGPRAFVEPDGAFTLGVAPGFHTLQLVDAYSGLLLASGDDRIEVRAGQDAEASLSAPLSEVAVQLAPPADGKPAALVDRLEIRHQPKADKNGARVQVFGGNDNYDQGIGVDIQPGQDQVRLWLPAGTATLLLRSQAASLRRDESRQQNEPLGREEVTIADEARLEARIQLVEPPAIAEPRAKDPDAAPEKDDGK